MCGQFDRRREGDAKSRLSEALRDWLVSYELPNSLLDSAPSGWEIHGDMAVLPKKAFTDWQGVDAEFWAMVANALGVARLARQGDIAGEQRRPSVELLIGENSWVTHREHGIDYSFDVTKSMFSAGNLGERGRIGALDCSGEIVLDMYSGIGYYTLPLLVRAQAQHVHACEWSKDAISALEHNLASNKVADKCSIYAGDNRESLSAGGVGEQVLGSCDRVILGLLPSSEDGWPIALAALKQGGGILHIHGNAPARKEADWAQSVVTELARLDSRNIVLEKLVKVKWYAPHIRHCVADITVG